MVLTKKSSLTNTLSAILAIGVYVHPRQPFKVANLSFLFIEPEEELEKKALLLGTTIENIRMVMSAP